MGVVVGSVVGGWKVVKDEVGWLLVEGEGVGNWEVVESKRVVVVGGLALVPSACVETDSFLMLCTTYMRDLEKKRCEKVHAYRMLPFSHIRLSLVSSSNCVVCTLR